MITVLLRVLYYTVGTTKSRTDDLKSREIPTMARHGIRSARVLRSVLLSNQRVKKQ